jgi:hypothetical protein
MIAACLFVMRGLQARINPPYAASQIVNGAVSLLKHGEL